MLKIRSTVNAKQKNLPQILQLLLKFINRGRSKLLKQRFLLKISKLFILLKKHPEPKKWIPFTSVWSQFKAKVKHSWIENSNPPLKSAFLRADFPIDQ